MKLEELSKEDLIKHIRRLEQKVNRLEKEKPKRYEPKATDKPFDFESSVCRPIALRISYIGTNYYGFSGTKEDTVETVEEQLFYALKTSKLIPHETKCAWAKCGRTDKGVSAFGQTVSLWIRSKLKKDDPRVCRWDQVQDLENAKHMAVKEPSMRVEYDFGLSENDELEYVLMINRLLPPDIRVLGWSPVSPTFDARFSCTYRLYHYYFNSKYLDAEKMRLGAQKFVGTHDCRHICKLDEQKVEKEDFFTRTIMESRIEDLGNGFCRYVVKGQAFLWHQVRNMMALLFFIGEAKEQPEIIDTMLDISKHPPRQGRPTYLMAPDAPLVLYDCGFPENTVKWRIDHRNQTQSQILGRHLMDQYTTAMIQVLQYQSLMDTASEYGASFTKPQEKKHKPILQRPRCDSVEVLIEKLRHSRKRQRDESEQDVE